MLIAMQRRTYIGLLSLTLASACGFDVRGGSGTPDDGMGSDEGSTDGSVFCPWPYEPQYAMPCPNKEGPPIDLPDGKFVLNTDTGKLTSGNGLTEIEIRSEVVGDVLVVWTTGFHIADDADLRVAGSMPLVIISTGAITVEGDIDGQGHSNSPLLGDNPPGANPSECSDMDMGAGAGVECAAEGASGGGGGSFALIGGQGGGGGSTKNCGPVIGMGPVPGGTFGVAVPGRPPNLRGGCPGGIGGLSLESGAVAGRPGSGGGAIALVTRDVLTISGDVNVGGGGGGGGAQRSGGGGGGSGGMIVLEGFSVIVTASGKVAANGGAGGGGSDGGIGQAGDDGEEDGTAAEGGMQHGMGTRGGKGGSRMGAAEASTISTRGGGGGGGGVGFVRVFAGDGNAQANGSLSPLASQ